MIQRAFRYRLYPTAEQASLMEATANARRFVYNLALEQRRDFWRQARAAGITLNYISQGRELTQLRAELPWLAAVHSTPLIQALRDLDRAYSGFFSRRAGFPRFQAKDRQMSFRHKACEARIGELGPKWAKVRVPKIGFVDMRLTRPIIGRVISVTFVRDALGWHASFVCEIKHESAETNLPHVGIDRGVTNTIALSTGELLSTPDIVMLDRRKREAQRTLSRKTRGSARHTKQRQRLAKLAAKCVRIRSHWQHETSTMIAARFGVVTLEDLNTAGLVRAGRGKRGINRAISEQGWRGLEMKLNYKLEERGGTLIKVNPAFTSQECSSCGTIDKRSRESQARFVCRHCGFAEHADTNAAKNILRRSSVVVEGCGYAPDEARTHGLAA